jgi:hypothetical protein
LPQTLAVQQQIFSYSRQWRVAQQHAYSSPLRFHCNNDYSKVKVKLSRYTPGQDLGGSRRLRLPEFLYNRHMKVVRLSALRTGRIYPRKDSWYSFLLEAESIAGSQCDRKD